MSVKIEKEIARIAGMLMLHHDDVATLRRAAMALHRWAEGECNGEIERDEKTGIPFRRSGRYVQANDPRSFQRIPDRETGALRRVAEVCARYGLHYFHQTDPRGLALYVSREPLDNSNYTQGTGIGGI